MKEAFIIGVDEKAKERLNKLTKSNKVTPIDLDYINHSQILEAKSIVNNQSKMVKNHDNLSYSQADSQELAYKMSTFLPQLKQRAPIVHVNNKPATQTDIHNNICSLSSSRFSSTLSSTSSNASSASPDVHTSPSSTNSKASYLNKSRPYEILTSSVIQHTHIDKKFCSSSSSSVSAASTSPPPSPTDLKLDPNESTILSHREMAIDCPDYFVPQVKTKPCYPPLLEQKQQHNNLIKPLLNIINNNVKPSSSTENKACLKKIGQIDLTQSSRDELAFDFDENIHSGNVSNTLNNELSNGFENKAFNVTQSTLDEPHSAKLNNEVPLISSSFSSIQYIDEDSKSKILINTPEQLVAHTDKNAQHRISVGKKLFDKQLQKQERLKSSFIRNSLRSNSMKRVSSPALANKCGMINNAFEMDDSEDKEVTIDIKCNNQQEKEDQQQNKEEILKISTVEFKLVQPNHLFHQNPVQIISTTKPKITHHTVSSRPPTPPPRLEKHLSFFYEQHQIQETVCSIDKINKPDEPQIVSTVTQDISSIEVNKLEVQDKNELIIKCNNDVNSESNINHKLRKVYETNNFENTISLYNKIIKLNNKLELKPITLNAKQLSQEV